jgi:multidrug efflux pump subunit AcrA (membrane-fusion protein)
MRKSIVLLTLAALTAVLATGCASAGDAPAGTLFPHVASDYVVRTQLERALVQPPPPPTVLAVASPLPQRARATARLARPAGGGGR